MTSALQVMPRIGGLKNSTATALKPVVTGASKFRLIFTGEAFFLDVPSALLTAIFGLLESWPQGKPVQ